MQSKNYIFDARPDFPFLITAKRYWFEDTPYSDDAFTLVFAHASGFCKEQWETVIDGIFKLLRQSEDNKNEKSPTMFKIREMWTIDAPNHGEAAILNEQTLQWGYDNIFSWDAYGRAIHAFLSGHGSRTKSGSYFREHNIIGIGHSLGAAAIMLSTTFQPSIPYKSFHLFEPTIYGPQWGVELHEYFLDIALKRRDIWPSSEEAFNTMRNRPAWKTWDERILKLFVRHGLRTLPTLDYPDKTIGVTLSCSKKQEAAACRDPTSRFVAYNLLRHLVKKIPTHITYGSIHECFPAASRHDILNNASGGIEHFSSVSEIEGAGHLVVHTHPDSVVEVIWKALRKDDISKVNKSYSKVKL
ncbi:Alpha/Beta hydrolase protein [Hygrophoropsis aurantiaca]|uniref:Alpha/Beta hydrolase protein n=1 Tax=Hygrophoropsis aurantiaca TaxID=72124 RepID=A0ACB7ZTF7_9AGAM|nr:Alpha/Beta hydrolase protein [Hygrophoropsis aurantiaca]